MHTGDKNAFCELYIRYKQRLWAYCYSFLKSAQDTDDMIQDIFANLWESKHLVQPGLSFSSFLYTIAKNRILNHLRTTHIKTQVHTYLSQQEAKPERPADEELEYKDFQRILLRAIELLPPKRRLVFNLSRNERLSRKEIAERLGISVYTVQEHISESLKFIKKYAGKYSEQSVLLFLFIRHIL
ncbi:MAG: RNA polymerase sigma-70 factor [Parabacteroides sp.]|nr:RNA polymerase sigma-70 factor [Parabacteroides sp.]